MGTSGHAAVGVALKLLIPLCYMPRKLRLFRTEQCLDGLDSFRLFYSSSYLSVLIPPVGKGCPYRRLGVLYVSSSSLWLAGHAKLTWP